jgi:hypothetical protein
MLLRHVEILSRDFKDKFPEARMQYAV